MIIQCCGLSGSGKTSLANRVKPLLELHGLKAEVIDGDVYRKVLCPDLGFSKADRHENIRRLAFVAGILSKHGMVAIISAINPYEAVRLEITARYGQVKTVHIHCPLRILIQRDTKQLYRRALLPTGHPDKINNLTGINDPFEVPVNPDLTINTGTDTIEESTHKLLQFILMQDIAKRTDDGKTATKDQV